MSFARERALFADALERPSNEWEAFVRGATDDGELAERVLKLLQASQEVDGLATGGAVHELDRETDSWIGRQLAGFRIVGEIGSGGMGRVFAAQQDEPRREVAVKVMRMAVASEEERRRFRLEADALARLNHPGIAQIYGAGTVELAGESAPWFAMERVDGRPLNEVDGSLRDRIELLAAVADAVHHAHVNGVIHRDLKPDNVLVGDSGQPKVLDFGVSKLIETEATAATLVTGAGQVVGTLAYMSPEQAAGVSVDTRADVFALGVMGFELVSGQLPIDVRKTSIIVALQRIVEKDPVRLAQLGVSVPKDVETILRHAMAKQADARYASAAEFAADLRRFLNHETITAVPPSAAEVLRKFVARNRALSGAVAASVLVLIGAVIATTSLLFRALDAESTANLESAAASSARDDALAVVEFLSEDLIAAAGATDLGQSASIRDALDYAVSKVPSRFEGRPLAEASVLLAAGRVYAQYDEGDVALPHLDRALELRRAELGDEHPEVLRGRAARAEVLYSVGQDVRGQDASGQDASGQDASGQDAGVLSELEALVETYDRVAAPADDSLRARSLLASAYRRVGRLADARQLLEPVVPAADELHRHGRQAWRGAQRLGAIWKDAGEFDRAAELLGAAHAAQRSILGPQHPETLTTQSSLGLCRLRMKDYAEAESLLSDALERYERVLGDAHVNTLACLNNLALVFDEQGQFDKAQPLLRLTVERLTSSRGPTHAETLNAQNNLASSLAAAGDHDGAVELFQATLAAQVKALDRNDVRMAMTRGNLAGSLVRLKRYADAEPIALEAERVLREQYGPKHGGARLARRILFVMYSQWGRPDDAAKWK